MKAKEFIPVSKPRNFVAKNQKTAGAGAHKDKKQEQKKGYEKHKQKPFEQGVAEGSLNELAGYGSDKKYKNLGSYKRYNVYVGKQKFNNLYYIAVAENPRTLDAKFKAKGNSAEEALNTLKDEIDKEIDVATKVSGQATLDFNVDFVKDILEMSSSVFYAKIVAGPKLVIAGPEMMEYPEIMRDEGFKASAIRTYKGGEGTTKLPGVPLSAKAASGANLIANGRYVLGSETIDKDGNRVFNLEFDSVVQASNDKMRLKAPAVTIGTNRSQGVAEGYKEERLKGCKCQHRQGDNKKCPIHGVQEGVAEGSYTTEKQILTRIRQIMYDRKLSGTESNAGELHRLKQQLKDMRSQQGVAEVKDSNFVGFMNKTLGQKVDNPTAKSTMPDFMKDAPVAGLDSMGYKAALNFGMKTLNKLTPTQKTKLAIKGENGVVNWLESQARKQGLLVTDEDDTDDQDENPTKTPNGKFSWEDLDEVQDFLSEIFKDPAITSWALVLTDGEPLPKEPVVGPFTIEINPGIPGENGYANADWKELDTLENLPDARELAQGLAKKNPKQFIGILDAKGKSAGFYWPGKGWSGLREESVAEARQSVAVKLAKAWDQQKAKSTASRERAKELLNPAKKDQEKKNG
jgi:hypothetical protein